MSLYRVTASALELRDGPGTDHRVLTQLPRGTEVEDLGADAGVGWLNVRASAQQCTGWCDAAYLQAVAAPAADAAPTRPAPTASAARSSPRPRPASASWRIRWSSTSRTSTAM